jgi:transporter family-2 protein
MYNLLSILIGALIAIMSSFNSMLSIYTGNYTSSVIIHSVGLFGTIVIMKILKYKIIFNKNLSLFLYSAGFIGVFTLLFNNITFIAIGASLTIALGLLGQTLSSIIIDHFGFLGVNVVKFNNKKIIALSIITLGIVIMSIY